MAINLQAPDIRELKPHITVLGVGGAGGNAVNNMIDSGLMGVEFCVANTDAQALSSSHCERIIQMGLEVTQGLGAGSQPEIGRAAAEEVIDEIRDQLSGAHMVFITAGMGGGTGTGAAPVIARAARDMGILTVGVVTKPFQFEGMRRMKVAEAGIVELQQAVDTLIVIPNQNLFRVANERTTFADAFAMADQVLYSGVACITDLMVKEGLINLDFADVRAIMRGMGKAMMGTGEASGERRAITAAEAAIANPLLDDVSMKGARGLLISITGGNDLTLYEVDEAATRIREEVDHEANIILGATFDSSLDGVIRVSVVATGIDHALLEGAQDPSLTEQRIAEVAERLRTEARQRVAPAIPAAPQSVAPNASLPEPAFVPPASADMVQQAPAAVVHRDVTIEPAQPRPSMASQPAMTPAPAEAAPHPQHFIPPQAERATIRPARMPRVDELPLPAQNQIRATRGEVDSRAAAADTKRMTLLQRLASVGLGRKEEPQPQPEPRQQRQAPPAGYQQAPVQPSATHAEYGKRPNQPQAPQGYRPAQGNLDQHGRAPQQARPTEDDQLEIPAFLRRQAN
ncbi:cell division protein FtsZ [Chelatococcus asaccharovorans]|uniref:cell division protein FtsZ n=1 Tax=Chelatococcus asaccharovorans TaxID=28210 RepID=UPI00224C78A4|nr:cell division protein FtsZ [Chelatococcus asaccharovorans]CAH1664750.1 Cell division protein FtsZ 1 [Chelatococcus asaccharovorans]CAH1682270.1 Cell division protein FtsZ 1 [Chelatococcus asaccharovorans]